MNSDVLRLVRLAECATFQEGYVNPSQRDPSYFGKDVKWLRATDLNNGFVFETGRRLSKKGFESAGKSATLFAPGTLAISKSGTIGRVGILQDYMCGNRAVINIKPNQTCDARFIFYTLLHRRPEIETLAEGSVQKNLYVSTLGNLKIELPPFESQKSIACLLGSLDDRIALLRETNATLEAIGQALFKSWFVDFDPVRARMEGRPPEGMDEATAALFPDGLEESEIGLVPRGWQVTKLKDWLSVLETGRRPKGGVSGILDGVPSIGAESIFRIGQFDYSKTKYVSDDFFTKMSSGALESHDVLLYKDGGKPGVFLPRVSMFGDGFPFEKCGINEHVFRIRLKAPFNQPFLYFWLWSDAVMHELKHRGGKAAIPGINQSDVKDQKISVPSKAVLSRFGELVAPMVSKIFNNSKSCQTLATLRDTLLPRLISGQLRLPEAEALLEEVSA